MVPRKTAKANALWLNSKRKAEKAAVPARSEASASSVVMTGATMDGVKAEMGLLKNDEDVGEVGCYQNVGEEVSVGEEIANEQRFVTPKEENQVRVLAEGNVTAGYLGEDDATVAVGNMVGKIKGENSLDEKNYGEYANKNEDQRGDGIAKEEGEEEEEQEYKEETDQSNKGGDEIEDMVEEQEQEEEGEEETGQSDEVGEEEDMVEEEEVMVEARENNARNEAEETCPVIEIDGQTADVIGDKKDVGEVSCEGVVVKEHPDEKVEKQKIIRSRKRVRKSTVMGRSAGKLDLKGVKEDLTEHNNGENVVSNIDNDKNNAAHGNEGNQNVGVDVENRGKKVQVITEKDMGESSKKKRKILKQKNRLDPLVEGSLVKVASENGGKSGRSNKKKGMLKPGTKGMIFMCSSNTKTDCYRYMVLGLPAGKRIMVENISKGMVLFLYDVDQKLLNGIYKAAADGGYNIEPEAFDSKFPAQVRFEILEGCLPLGEEKFSRSH